MRNITIAKKLVLLILIALVSLVVVGGSAAYQLGSAQKRFGKVQEELLGY